ncbi:MAG: hypothetical protein ACR2PF_16545, partial [Rhizobiaceae bacterium]
MPAVHSVDVDWPRVRESTNLAVFKGVVAYRDDAKKDFRGVRREIATGVETTEEAKRMFTERLKNVQAMNANEIQKSADAYDDHIETAKFICHTSADVVMIGATILS